MRFAGHDICLATRSELFLQALTHPAGEKIGCRMAVAQLQDRQIALSARALVIHRPNRAPVLAFIRLCLHCGCRK